MYIGARQEHHPRPGPRRAHVRGRLPRPVPLQAHEAEVGRCGGPPHRPVRLLRRQGSAYQKTN